MPRHFARFLPSGFFLQRFSFFRFPFEIPPGDYVSIQAFLPYDERYRLITETIKPWYAERAAAVPE